MPRPVFQLLVVIFLSLITIDFAISGDMDEIYKNRLKGWEGVAFECLESANIKNSICTDIKTDAEFLATASGIKFYNAKDFSEAIDLQTLHNYLMLKVEVELVANSLTNNQCRTCAFFIEIKAYAFYVSGIDLGNLPNSPMAVPRTGDFVLWKVKPGAVFTGPLEYGRGSIIKDAEKHLKRFFILFMKANPK